MYKTKFFLTVRKWLLVPFCFITLMGTAQKIHFTDTAVLVFPNLVSSPHADVKLTFSPDGKMMFWGGIDWVEGKTDWDIWMSVFANGKWSKPVIAPFCSDSNDFDPHFCPDGKGVFFFSNRAGGLGGDDIYFAPFDARTKKFGAAVNLGPNINTPGNEWAPVCNVGHTRLLFSSDGRGGAGGQNLFTAKIEKGKISEAVNLGTNINSAADDFDAAFLADGNLIFTSTRDNKALASLFFWSKSKKEVMKLPLPQVNSSTFWTFGPSINLRERGTLYFSSHRDQGLGRTDIYKIHFSLK